MLKRKNFLRVLFLFVVPVFLSVFLGLQNTALAYNVAYIYGNAEAQNTAPNYLNGHFDSVTNIDGDAKTLPSLAELMAYDAIMVSPNWPWTYANRSDDLGNLLADYVDAGGGLVMTMFSWQSPGVNDLRGRLLSGGYSPFIGGSNPYSYASLSTFTVHPIMAGVNTVNGYFRDAVTLSNDAQSIATWSDGVPFVAIDSGSGVVGINLFPEDFYGEISGDYATLFINALNWAASQNKKHSKPKHGMGWVITIDGMDAWSSMLTGWAHPTSYLNDAIDTTNPKKHWRQVITEKIGPTVPFIWTRRTPDTREAVHDLYKYIKYLNSTNRPVIVLSHSWGTVLIYIALRVHDDIHIDKLITLGSPLDSSTPGVGVVTDWWLAMAGIFLVDKPSNLDVWHNYWADCDSISSPILVLSSKEDFVNKKDYEGASACHASYFEDSKKWDKILQDVISK
jgi:hypothetical protein